LVKNPGKRIELEDVMIDDWINVFAEKSNEYMKYFQKLN
jgi:hypothetical protein